MSQKNHVEIDIFKEPEHHLDPNQVHSRPLLPPKKQINQNNVISGRLEIFDFQPGAFKNIYIILPYKQRKKRLDERNNIFNNQTDFIPLFP